MNQLIFSILLSASLASLSTSQELVLTPARICPRNANIPQCIPCSTNCNNRQTICTAICRLNQSPSKCYCDPGYLYRSETSEKCVLIEDCDRATKCAPEPDVGPCKAAIERWYYNKKTEKCEKFTWGGCGGNLNNFPSEEACYRRCIIRV